MKATKEEMTLWAEKLEVFLTELLSRSSDDARRVWEAMRYSTLGAGKRIRPYLTMKVCEALGGNAETALWFGAALELVHTYSLIHDDLPCMDNDDFRRGRLTCHKMFDEATAVLAGDALLTYAFEVVADAPATDHQKVEATRVLAAQAGANHMICGQIMDLTAEHHTIAFDTLKRMYAAKTGALMNAAVELGCIAADCSDEVQREAFMTYAGNIGMTFQIIDDLLDVYGDMTLGKPLGSDEKNGKNTYLTFTSPSAAEQDAKCLTQEAKDAIAGIPGTAPLAELADKLLHRKK